MKFIKIVKTFGSDERPIPEQSIYQAIFMAICLQQDNGMYVCVREDDLGNLFWEEGVFGGSIVQGGIIEGCQVLYRLKCDKTGFCITNKSLERLQDNTIEHQTTFGESVKYRISREINLK